MNTLKMTTTNSNRMRLNGWALSLALAIMPMTATAANDLMNVSDLDMEIAIEEEFLTSHIVPETYVDISVSGGVAELSGWVNTILAKEKAETIAANVLGVESVVNRIEVRPAAREDSEIESAIETALLLDPAAESYEVNVRVNDGTAVLTGMVQSWGERELAATIAKGVKGVKDIKNQITVRFQADVSDEEVEEIVNHRLENDVLVRSNMIAVNSNDGVLTLSGTVGSLSEKNRAERLALVNGVRRIKSSNLDVDPMAFQTMLKSREYKPDFINKSDDEIEEAVQDAFLYDPRVSSFNPEVNVKEGVVTLRGTVSDYLAKQAAEDTAYNTVGVWKVNNYLKVRPDVERPINTIAENARTIIKEDPMLDKHEINVVVTDDGTAYIDGNVDSAFEKMRAERKAYAAVGVIDVVNRITVGESWVAQEDWAIQDDIENQLWWSPYVDVDEVSVTVNDGVATLQGTVDTWTESLKAEENAYEGGAKDVNNRLDIRYDPHDLNQSS